MSTNNSPQENSFEFDVIVSLPPGANTDILEKQALEGLGITPEAVSKLMHSLSDARMVKIKSAVPQDQADEVATRFRGVGFQVEVRHSLTLKEIEQHGEDGKTTCPACDKSITPSVDRKCPECGIFIDKVTPEFLLRKQIKDKERARLAALQKMQLEDASKKRLSELEKQLRDEVNKELEEELGVTKAKKPLFSGKLARYATPIVITLGIAGAFFGGRATVPASDQTSPSKVAQLASESSATEAGGGNAAVGAVENFLKGSAKMGAAMAKNGGGISMSSIIAEAQQAGGGAGLESAPGVSDGDGVGTLIQGNEKPTQSLPANAKKILASELALTLAEIGQIPRAREIVGRAYKLIGTDPPVEQAISMRLTHLAVESWSIVYGHGGNLSEQIDAVAKAAEELPTPEARAIGFGVIGEILSGSVSLKPDVSDAFFHRAGNEYSKEKGKASQNEVAHRLLVSKGRGLYNAIRFRAERGLVDSARKLASQLQAMHESAPPVTGALLLGLDSQAKKLLGDSSGAQKSFEMALQKAQKASSMTDEARILRAVVVRSENYANDKFKETLLKVLANAEKWGGHEYASVLVETGQIHAQNGNPQALQETSTKLESLAQTLPGADDFIGQLTGLSEIALAKHARRTGGVAESEEHLRRAAALLFN